MRVVRELGAVSDLVAEAAAIVPVVAQEVVDLLHRPLVVVARVDASLGSCQGHEGGVACSSTRVDLAPSFPLMSGR